ncbi:MAG: T9SS type A sorting domain-containing protein, partial [Fluviicola sp.]|nr:T9SS type A sorting domain-containing protein [Fluviicola sp.]
HIWLDNVNLDGEFAGVSETDANWGVHVFPNPTTGSITVSWNKTMVPDQIDVINMMGQTISTLSCEAGSNQLQLNLSNEASGVYLLKLVKNGQTKLVRIAKQ